MKKQKHKNVPEQVVVVVDHYDDGTHVELYTSMDKFFLLSPEFSKMLEDETIPPRSSVVVLACTWERPDWYHEIVVDPDNLDEDDIQYTYDGTWDTVYTWRIVGDDSEKEKA